MGHEAKAATCSENGNIAYWQCSRENCQKVFSDPAGENEISKNDIEVTGSHTPGEPEFVWSQDRTSCTREVRCSGCNEVLSTINATLIDDKGSYAASCFAPGSSVHNAVFWVDGKPVMKTLTETIPELPHTPTVIAAKEATCKETGLTEGSRCSVCNADIVPQETTPKADHTPVAVAGKEATCTETGLTEGSKCSFCGTVLTEQTEIAKALHTLESIPAKKSTCTEPGLTEGAYCTVCEDVIVEQTTVDALGHDYHAVATDPTCTEDGFTTYTCSVCEDSYVDDEVDALGHTEENVYDWNAERTDCTKTVKCSVCNEIIVPAQEKYSVREYGSYEAKCEADGQRRYEAVFYENGKYDLTEIIDVLPKLGHEEVVVAGKAPTCTENGLTDGVDCSRCKANLVGRETIAKIPHTPVFVEAKDSNCTETGLKVHWQCTLCKNVFEDEACKVLLTKEDVEIPAKGHSWDYSTYKVTTEATCTEGGEAVVGCKNCDEQHTIPTFAAGHSYIYHDVKNATCTEKGNNAYQTCEKCDYTTYVEIPATGHTEVTVYEIPATCTEAGESEWKYCAVCQATLVEKEVIPAKGHSWDYSTYKVITEATCTEGGEAVVDCKNCDEQHTIPTFAAGHSYIYHDAKNATCTEKGNNAYQTCEKCDYTTYEEIPATGHTEVTVYEIPATCTEAGESQWKYCAVCQATLVEKEVIPAAGHREEVVFNWNDERTACTRVVKCAVCEEVYSSVEAQSVKETGSYPATCEVEGQKKYEAIFFIDGKYSVENKIDVIEALGHKTVEIAGKEATCVNEGLTVGERCTVCHATVVAQNVIPTVAHTPEFVEGTAATCTETGIKDHWKCSFCKNVYGDAECTELLTKEDTEIAALGHNYTEYVETKTAATCMANKVDTFKCERCDSTEDREIAQSKNPENHTGNNTTGVNVKEATYTQAGYTGDTVCECGVTVAYGEEIPMLLPAVIEKIGTKETVEFTGEEYICVSANVDVAVLLADVTNGTEYVRSENNKGAEGVLATGDVVILRDKDGKEVDRRVIVVKGDLDGDGKLSAADARLALRYSVGLEKLAPEYVEAAMVSGAEKVSAGEARLILRASVGLETRDSLLIKKN